MLPQAVYQAAGLAPFGSPAPACQRRERIGLQPLVQERVIAVSERLPHVRPQAFLPLAARVVHRLLDLP